MSGNWSDPATYWDRYDAMEEDRLERAAEDAGEDAKAEADGYEIPAQQPAPLSDERLAEARRIVAMFAGTATDINFLWDSSVFVDLLAEVDRLRIVLDEQAMANDRLRTEVAARVPLRGWVTPDLTPGQAHDIAAHAPRLDVERHLVWCYEQIDRLRAELAADEGGSHDDRR